MSQYVSRLTQDGLNQYYSIVEATREDTESLVPYYLYGNTQESHFSWVKILILELIPERNYEDYLTVFGDRTVGSKSSDFREQLVNTVGYQVYIGRLRGIAPELMYRVGYENAKRLSRDRFSTIGTTVLHRGMRKLIYVEEETTPGICEFSKLEDAFKRGQEGFTHERN